MTNDSIDRARVVRANLEAISRGRSPSPETVGVWLKEFQKIPTDQLDDLIRQARSEHSERVENGKGWGHITPDDVLRIHRRLRRKARANGGGPPENPDCSYRCDFGRVSVRDGEGYEYCVRCACTAGDYWRSSPAYGKGPSVAECLAGGWERIGEGSSLPDSHKEWIEKRTAQVGARKALDEYQQWSEQRAE